MLTEHVDVLIIGAGPAGSVAACLLRRHGHQVLIVEKSEFPRHAIGESLLPQSMGTLETAGVLRDVIEAGFQHKNGVAFSWRNQYADFDFRDKIDAGWATALQVQREDFDDILAGAAERAGATVRFLHEVVAVDMAGPRPRAMLRSPDGTHSAVQARFVLDASGSAQVLTKLLDLPVELQPFDRVAVCARIDDGIGSRVRCRRPPDFDRNKLLVSLHPAEAGVWFWLIPLSHGWSSIGVVASADRQGRAAGEESNDMADLQASVAQEPMLASLLADARWSIPARRLSARASRPVSLCGPGYALLGNAGSLPDPVFCSGVAVAIESARLAARTLHDELVGIDVDWHASYDMPLKAGIDVFASWTDAWRDGSFMNLLFERRQSLETRRMISSFLAGYVWERDTPLFRDALRRLRGARMPEFTRTPARTPADPCPNPAPPRPPTPINTTT